MLALVFASTYALYAWISVAPDDRVSSFIIAGVGQSLAWVWLYERRHRMRPGMLCLAAGLSVILARLSLPLYEDDFYRYVWDGWRTLQSLQPYRYAPSEMKGLEEIRGHINFPELVTIYPATTQWIFAVFSSISRGHLETFLWLFTLTGTVATWLVARNAFDGRTASLLMMHPLIVKEWWQSCHFDIWLVALFLLAMSRRSAFLAGLATNIKLVSLPAWLVAVHQRRRDLPWLGLGLVMPWLLFPGGVEDFIVALAHFGGAWEMNSGVFRWVREAVGSASVARAICGTAWGVAAFFLQRSRLSSFEKTFWALLSLVLLSPVANPWYFTWSLPFAFALSGRSRTLALLGFASLPLSYAFYRKSGGGISLERWWDIEHLWCLTLAGGALFQGQVNLLQPRRARQSKAVAEHDDQIHSYPTDNPIGVVAPGRD